MFYIYDVNRANIIKKVYELQNIDKAHWDDIRIAFHNYFYYVNPKNYKNPDDEHYNRFENYFNYEIKNGALSTSSREEIVVAVYLKVVKEMFDPKYFEERLEYHKNNNDKECLFEYLNKLDIAQLKEFLPIFFGSIFVFSWSRKTVEAVWKLLNEECLKKDPSVPIITEIYDKHGYFNKKLPIYFFEYLNKEFVLRLMCDNVCDENKYNAATLARVMYTEGIEEVEWTESLWRCDC